MIRGLAHAKVNLFLRVGSLRADGFHPVHSLFQSVSWSDRLELSFAAEDEISGWHGGEVPDAEGNLAWRAVVAMRTAVGSERLLRLRLDKQIPVAAGLGGGSADAAAALHLACQLLGGTAELVAEIAPELGSDVPFCVTGGTALVGGRGETVHPIETLTGFVMALVVPPVELATPRVFAEWDRLGEPSGPAVAAEALPPSLRPHGPLINDLYPAAAALAPELDEWRSHLADAWGRPVMLSGSGPALVALFVDADEAEGALAVVRPGARASHVAAPVAKGWGPSRDA